MWVVEPLLLLHDSIVVCLDSCIHHELDLSSFTGYRIFSLSFSGISNLFNQLLRVDLLYLLFLLRILLACFFRFPLESPPLLVHHIHAVSVRYLSL